MQSAEYEINKIKIPSSINFTSLSDFEIQRAVNKSKSFCEVKLGKYKDKYYALKIIHKKQISPLEFQSQYTRLYNQITILYRLSNNNIIKLYWHNQDLDDIYMLLEYGGIKIFSLIKKKKIQEEQAKHLLRQITIGIKQIHDAGFIHRDLSTDNILVSRDKQIKIIDFGFADQIITQRKTKLGTLYYMAPQIFSEESYTYKIDIWSLGVIAYEMLHQDIPFCSSRSFDQDTFATNRDKLKLDINADLSKEATSFIKKLLIINPEYRPTINQVLSHPFLRNQSQGEEDQFSVFNRNQTQKKQRKTKVYQPTKQIKQQFNNNFDQAVHKIHPVFIEDKNSIFQLERALKQSMTKVFISLHNQKHIFSELLKAEKMILERNIAEKQKQLYSHKQTSYKASI